MPKNNFINSDELTLLRRSQRLLDQHSVEIKNSKSKKNQLHHSSISSSPLIRNISYKKTPEDYTSNLVGSVNGSANSRKSINGSRKSTRKINGVEGFQGCRRSPRFENKTPEIFDKNTPKMSQKLLDSHSVKIQKSKSKKIPSSISPSVETHFKSPLCSIQNVSCKKTHEDYMSGSVGLIDGCRNSRKLSSGSRKSSRKINGVEGFQGCRRSPRFFSMEINTPEIFQEKTCVNKESELLKCGVLTDMKDKDVFSEELQKGRLVKRRVKSLGVMGFEKIGGKDEVSSKSSKGSTRMTEEGRMVCSVISPAMRPKRGEKKRRKVNCGIEGSWDKCISKEVSERTDTHLRSPLSSIENIFPRVLGKAEVGVNLSKEYTREIEGGRRDNCLIMPKGGGDEKRRDITTGSETGDRCINNQCDENCGLQGWTKDQEMALQKAYFAAKPSPHFWKKVSKMVPGKSAQECFDKVHSDTITPIQPKIRSRAKKAKSSPLGHFSLSGSKLLEPAELNVKKPRGNKRTKYLAQKTVRHLLQKHKVVNEGYKTDLFSILEPTISSFTQGSLEIKTLSTPKSLQTRQDFFHDCHERSLSACKKPLSRFSNSSRTPLVSPPVLKQIKNMTVHEKYIDQLHCREAKRTARGRRCITAKEDRKESGLRKTGVVEAAKNSLVSDARDMINKFQHLQANAMNNYEVSNDDDGSVYGEDGGEDES